MRPTDPCLLDSSIWIAGQSDPAWLKSLVKGLPDVATCLTAVAEFAVGLYAPRQKATRDIARSFLEQQIQQVAWLSHLPDDFPTAARLIGQAVYHSAGKPPFADGLIAACATRCRRVVWTKDVAHFKALGCQTYNPTTDPDHPITVPR